jgi:N-acetylglucosamine kinase-like BadF-type ATPase
MTRYFLGADVGATKTHALITDETGRAVGIGTGGPGNHENVGYEGLLASLRTAMEGALNMANVQKEQIAGAGFGVAGYDWPSERVATLNTIGKLGLNAPVDAVNDTIVGLIAGAEEGWGIAVVSGTGCNCRGWDKARTREGAVTGGGDSMGEYAGSTDLTAKALRAIRGAGQRRRSLRPF